MRTAILLLLGLAATAWADETPRAYATYRFSNYADCLGKTVNVTVDTLESVASDPFIYQASGSAVDSGGAVYAVKEVGTFAEGKQRLRLVSSAKTADILLTVNLKGRTDPDGKLVKDSFVSDVHCDPSGYRSRIPRLRN